MSSEWLYWERFSSSTRLEVRFQCPDVRGKERWGERRGERCVQETLDKVHVFERRDQKENTQSIETVIILFSFPPLPLPPSLSLSHLSFIEKSIVLFVVCVPEWKPVIINRGTSWFLREKAYVLSTKEDCRKERNERTNVWIGRREGNVMLNECVSVERVTLLSRDEIRQGRHAVDTWTTIHVQRTSDLFTSFAHHLCHLLFPYPALILLPSSPSLSHSCSLKYRCGCTFYLES